MTARVRADLLVWFDRSARDLPWRRTRDPYAIWVSEVMLQQTRVDTVIPFYARFLGRFPTVRALAEAPEDDVLHAWSGLGYYRRARLLHAGAKAVMRDHGGVVPGNFDALLALPGVGRYTAGAIGSIGFELEVPVLDGNVARVLARLHGLDTPLGRRDTENALWEHATELAHGERPGALNQALMELGATVCTPSSPSCLLCPVRAACVAQREGRTAELPVPRARPVPTPTPIVAVDARTPDGRAWLVRSEGALFGGLFGLPTAEGATRRDAQRALREAGVQARLEAAPHAALVHVLTHRRLEVTLFRATRARAGESEARRAVNVEAIDVGISTLTRKLLAQS